MVANLWFVLYTKMVSLNDELREIGKEKYVPIYEPDYQRELVGKWKKATKDQFSSIDDAAKKEKLISKETKKAGVNIWIAFLCGISTGAIIGLINGLLVTKVGVPSFIVTLGMLSVVRGLALILSGGWPLSGFQKEVFYSI